MENTNYFLQKVSKDIFEKKYCLHGEQSVEEVFRGIAKEVASVEKDKDHWEEVFYEEMLSGRFIPAGRILANARPNSPMKNYNNCFTIDVEDSMEGIFDALKEDALISKMGGGVGFNISKIRPKESLISTGGTSSGVISFLKIFDQSAKTIHTGGSRRSAHIAILNIDHPEIEDFIVCKQGDNNKTLTQFNISVGITDDFVSAVKNNSDWDLKFNGEVYKTVKAVELYELLTRNAYNHNEPGIFNLDVVEKYNNGYWAFKMDRVNPCGELCMPSYSLCCLGAINLTKFVRKPFTSKAFFDIGAYNNTITIGIRFLDNILDCAEYPLEKIEKFSKQWRRIGLGITGLGNMFSMMQMKYGEIESQKISEKIAKELRDTSYLFSSILAKEKGTFPAFDYEKFIKASFVQQLPENVQKEIKRTGIRNIQMNTIAPTGTTSLSLGNNCSSGIEPAFAYEYDRTIRTGKGDETTTEKVYDYAWLLYQSLDENFGKEAPIPEYFSTTSDVSPVAAIDIQAIWQEYIDHSISKSHNLKPGTTFEEYTDLFMLAYDKGLKGFTTFNPEGSMKGILSTEKSVAVDRHADKRPEDLVCDIYEITVNKEKMIALVGLHNDYPYEIFVTDNPDNAIQLDKHKKGIIRKVKKGKYDLILENGSVDIKIKDIGKTFDDKYGALSRMVSMSLRHRVPLQFVVEQLSKSKFFVSFEKAVARVLKKYIDEGEQVLSNEKCPECGAALKFIEGCKTCSNMCGFSVCG